MTIPNGLTPQQQRLVEHARVIVDYWKPKYPRDARWVNQAARDALVRSEDAWLEGFAGLTVLTHPQVDELIGWKWQRYAARRAKARSGVAADWHHTSERIVEALAIIDSADASDAASGAARDTTALAKLRADTGGIPGWHASMASVVFMACRPDLYTVVDSLALKTGHLLWDSSPELIRSIAYFPPSTWVRYLELCRLVSTSLGIALRDVDRAFVMCAGREP